MLHEHTKEKWAPMSTQRRDEHWWAHKGEMSADEYTKIERWTPMSTQRRNEHWWAHKWEMSTDEHTKERLALMSTQRRHENDEHTKERWARMSTQSRDEHWWAHKGEMRMMSTQVLIDPEEPKKLVPHPAMTRIWTPAKPARSYSPVCYATSSNRSINKCVHGAPLLVFLIAINR